MLSKSASMARGVTLVELLIGIAILSMVLAIGIPSFGVWIQNSRIRNAADAIANGLQLARTEAVRRNSTVTFTSQSNSGWTVTVGATEIQKRSPSDGSDHVEVNYVGGGNQATFNGVGALTNNTDGSASLTQVDITSTAVSTSDGARPLRVVVSLAGSVRMCDPNVSSSDPRRC